MTWRQSERRLARHRKEARGRHARSGDAHGRKDGGLTATCAAISGGSWPIPPLRRRRFARRPHRHPVTVSKSIVPNRPYLPVKCLKFGGSEKPYQMGRGSGRTEKEGRRRAKWPISGHWAVRPPRLNAFEIRKFFRSRWACQSVWPKGTGGGKGSLFEPISDMVLWSFGESLCPQPVGKRDRSRTRVADLLDFAALFGAEGNYREGEGFARILAVTNSKCDCEAH